MTPTTPSGTRTRSTRRPFGRTHPSSTSPTGSPSAATHRSPSAISSMRASSSARRSIAVAPSPPVRARSMSAAFASRMPLAPLTSRSADERSTSSRTAELAHATARDAARTRRARCSMPVAPITPAYRPPCRRPHGAAPDRGRSDEDHEIVTVHRDGREVLRQRVAPPADPLGRTCRRVPHQPLGEDRAVGPGDLDGVVRLELAAPADYPRREERPPAVDERPAGAVVDHEPTRRAQGVGDPELPGRQALGGRPEGGPDSGRALHRRGHDPLHPAVGDDRRDPRARRHLRRGELRGHPPRPEGAGSPGRLEHPLVDLHHLFDERRRLRAPWVGRVEAGGVGQEDEQVRRCEVRDQRSKPVVVAEADLLVRDGVVLVDDGDDAEAEEVLERAARVQVPAAVTEVERREEDLAHDEPLDAEAVLPGAHEPLLADGRDGLQDRRVGRTGAGCTERRPPAGDRARADEDHAVPGAHEPRQLRRQLRDRPAVDAAVLGGERGGPDLDDDRPRHRRPPLRRRRAAGAAATRGASGGWSLNQVKHSAPTATSSPSCAPALASARSTPSRRSRRTASTSAASSVRSERFTARWASRPTTRQACVPARSTRTPSGSGRWTATDPAPGTTGSGPSGSAPSGSGTSGSGTSGSGTSGSAPSGPPSRAPAERSVPACSRREAATTAAIRWTSSWRRSPVTAETARSTMGNAHGCSARSAFEPTTSRGRERSPGS